MTCGKFLKFKICLALIIIVNIQNSALVNPECKTTECKNLASMYTKIMNNHLEPCDNFFDYVCDGWKTYYPRPEEEEGWYIDKELEYRARKNVRDLLMDKTVSRDVQINNAKLLFKTCMDSPFLELLDLNKFKNMVRAVDPQWTWSQVDDYYMTMGVESAMIKHGIVYVQSIDRITAFIRRPYSTYGAVKREKPWTPDELRHYKAFLKNIVVTAVPASVIPRFAVDQAINDVLSFREDFNKTIASLGDRNLQKSTIGVLQENYDKTVKTDSAKINWLDKIRAMYKNGKDAYGGEISKSTEIAWDIKFISKFAEFLSGWSNTVIENHIHLYFAERHLRHTARMMDDLSKSYTEGASETGEIRYVPEKWEWCYVNMNMRTSMGKMYVEKYFPKSAKRNVEDLFSDAKDILEKQIGASDWLDPNTKRRTIQKAHNIQSQIGYPLWYDPNSKAEPDEDDVDPLQVTASFEQTENLLSISASYMQWPIFHSKLPHVIQYGSTVTLLGHEMYHGFDTSGIEHDMNAEEQEWWPTAMRKKYQEQVKCFERQYAEYRKKEFAKMNLKMPKLEDLPPTVDEDIPDVMGLKLAYIGFTEKLQQRNGTCDILPGFKKFSCEQMFFISYASTFCTDMLPSFKEKLLFHDSHSLPFVRVNGAVANLPEFSAAFNCRNGHQLKLKKTCDLWKK